ncbi:MAG TPA: hypothetical protein V6D14_11790 [Coleofasciculaceae cyanobacterium]
MYLRYQRLVALKIKKKRKVALFFVTVYAAITLRTLHSHRNYYSACATMKKQSFPLAAIISAAVLVSGITLVTTNSAHACPFGKNKGIKAGSSGNSPTLTSRQLNSENSNINKLEIIGGGLAALAGVLVVGMVYKARRAGQEADKFLAGLPQEASFEATSWQSSIPLEELCESKSEQETADSKPEKDLTLVG